jgi:hypothetical protein
MGENTFGSCKNLRNMSETTFRSCKKPHIMSESTFRSCRKPRNMGETTFRSCSWDKSLKHRGIWEWESFRGSSCIVILNNCGPVHPFDLTFYNKSSFSREMAHSVWQPSPLFPRYFLILTQFTNFFLRNNSCTSFNQRNQRPDTYIRGLVFL